MLFSARSRDTAYRLPVVCRTFLRSTTNVYHLLTYFSHTVNPLAYNNL